MKTYSQNEIQSVAKAFQDHQILAFPTDTVYGVGVLYGNLNDLERLKHAKNRPETKPIPVMVSNIEQMETIAVVDDRIRKIAKSFLPGALTLILKVQDHVDRAFTNDLDTIAIRIPESDFVLALIDQLNTPLFVTSANQSGAKTALTSEDVLEQLPKIDGIVLGECQKLQASTIVDLSQEEIKILREGPISFEQIQNAIKQVQ